MTIALMQQAEILNVEGVEVALDHAAAADGVPVARLDRRCRFFSARHPYAHLSIHGGS